MALFGFRGSPAAGGGAAALGLMGWRAERMPGRTEIKLTPGRIFLGKWARVRSHEFYTMVRKRGLKREETDKCV